MHWIQHYQECGIELFNIANASLPKRRKSKTSTPKQQKKPSVKLQEESVLTTRDAAKYIQVNHRFIEKLVKSGDLPATRFGKIIRILKRDLDDFMWRHRYA
jgi:excisionase family DNA binding protein